MTGVGTVHQVNLPDNCTPLKVQKKHIIQTNKQLNQTFH